MATKGQDIVSVIKQQIEQFGMSVTMTDVGTVIEVGDGIARIQDSPDANIMSFWSSEEDHGYGYEPGRG